MVPPRTPSFAVVSCRTALGLSAGEAGLRPLGNGARVGAGAEGC
jgi:hypothetical protein